VKGDQLEVHIYNFRLDNEFSRSIQLQQHGISLKKQNVTRGGQSFQHACAHIDDVEVAHEKRGARMERPLSI
jgi:hypothetical protein